jgi:hypothetical protein
MMRPHHRFVDFVEANKEKLSREVLLQHSQYTSRHMPPTQTLSCTEWGNLCANPSHEAMELLRCHPHQIVWTVLSSNPSSGALDLLEANVWKISWFALCSNPSPRAIALLRTYPDRILYSLAGNTSREGFALFQKHRGRMTCQQLALSPFPEAEAMLDPEELAWDLLSSNPAPWAHDLLMAHQPRICWSQLSSNPSVRAVAMLKTNPEKVSFLWLLWNTSPEALPLMEANLSKISFGHLTLNPIIFELDRDAMRAQMAPLRDELLRHCMHPDRVYQAEHHWLLF